MCNKSYLKNFAVESTTLIPLLEKSLKSLKTAKSNILYSFRMVDWTFFFLLRYSNNTEKVFVKT